MKMVEHVERELGIPWSTWKSMTIIERVAAEVANRPEVIERPLCTCCGDDGQAFGDSHCHGCLKAFCVPPLRCQRSIKPERIEPVAH